MRHAFPSRRLLAGVLLALLPWVQAQADESAASYAMNVGADQVIALSDGIFDLDSAAVLVAPKGVDVPGLLKAAGDPATVPTSVNAFLVHTAGRWVLIDTGVDVAFGPSLGHLQASLARAGVKPEQISEVLLTHLHIDHVSGLMHEGKMAFPHATVRVNQQELAFWTNPASVAKLDPSVQSSVQAAIKALAPYQAAGRVKTFAPGAEVAPGIVALDGHGHTVGHTVYQLTSRGQHMLFWGDLVHVGDVQFGQPAITVHFDSDQAQARQERQKLLAEVAAKGYWVAGAHLAFPGIGHVVKQGEGYRWQPVGPEQAAR